MSNKTVMVADNKIKLLQTELKECQTMIKKHESFKKIIGKAIHDIQSPLSSLQAVLESNTKLPEQERIILRASMTSITDIVAQLLHHFSPTNHMAMKNNIRQPVLVSSILSEIINDRKIKHKDSFIEFKYNLNKLNAFLFIKAFPSDFKRTVSNVINNAIESLPNSGGKVEVKIASNDEWVYVSILDDGKGMPKELQNKIKNGIAVTEGKKTGHGIGLTQVQDMLKNNHGSFEIASSQAENSHGTTITLRFPRIISPDWSIENICITPGDTIIILDDDMSVHDLWGGRFNHILEKIPSITIKHFFRSSKVVEYLKTLSSEQKQAIWLFSTNELGQDNLSGIEVIKKCKIKRSLLISSYCIDNPVRRFAIKHCVKVLPKELINYISLTVDQAGQTSKGQLAKVHMVFVDDEKMVMGALVTKYFNNLVIDQYSNPFEFLNSVDQYPKDTKLILDNYYYDEAGLPYRIDGITMAQKLHDKGYINLFLLSGERFDVPRYLKLILKSDFESIRQLGTL